MSFSIDFHAKKEDILGILEKEHAPECVKSFIEAAAFGFSPEMVVHVKANGHLYDGHSYEVSTADIRVTPIRLKVPSV